MSPPSLILCNIGWWLKMLRENIPAWFPPPGDSGREVMSDGWYQLIFALSPAVPG